MADVSKLSTAKSDFEQLRRGGRIYVDHTDMIYEFACEERPVFLSRPRRFGKSLLVSTLESLFEHGSEYFKGLKIASLWDSLESDRRYRVIRLDFSAFAYISASDLDRKICDVLLVHARALKIELAQSLGEFGADFMLTQLVSAYPGKLVLLIDEYDYPLTHSLENQEKFESYRQYLQGLFGAVKVVSDRMRLVFITGVGRFARSSVFSQLNNLRDLSLEGRFAPLLGMTGDDICRYFDDS